VLGLFVFGLGMESIYLLALAWFFDGDLNTVMSLLSFGVSYGYRMLPIMIDEFHTIVNGFRLRNAPLASKGFLGWRALLRIGVTLVQSFYPMMLNTAKRTRTTVEALETRGFTFAGESAPARDLRLAQLRVTSGDVTIMVVTVVLVIGAFVVGGRIPVFARNF
jgi:energy-coupling factor transport system permease protein